MLVREICYSDWLKLYKIKYGMIDSTKASSEGAVSSVAVEHA